MRALAITVLVAGCATGPNSPPAASTTSSAARSPLAKLEASRDLDGKLIGRTAAPTVVVVIASWCGPCRAELRVFDSLRPLHKDVRWIAVNYKWHEEYDARGSSETIRELASTVPWLRVVPADDALFDAMGAPSKIPTVIVYDKHGALAARYNRHERNPPTATELDDLLTTLE